MMYGKMSIAAKAEFRKSAPLKLPISLFQFLLASYHLN